MPGLSKKAEEMARPEASRDPLGRIHNGVSVELDEQDCSFVSQDSPMIPPGKDLLEQIFAVEAQER